MHTVGYAHGCIEESSFLFSEKSTYLVNLHSVKSLTSALIQAETPNFMDSQSLDLFDFVITLMSMTNERLCKREELIKIFEPYQISKYDPDEFELTINKHLS